MATILPRCSGYVCRSCQKLATAQPSRRRFVSQVASPPKQEAASHPRRTIAIPLRRRATQSPEFPPAQNRSTQSPELPVAQHRSTPARASKPVNTRFPPAKAASANTFSDPAQKLKDFEKFVAHVQSTDAAADHDDVLEALMDMYELSNVLVHGTRNIPDEDGASSSTAPSSAATSQGKDLEDALLDDLAEDKSTAARPVSPQTTDSVSVSSQDQTHMTASFRANAAATLSHLSYTLLRDPKVYITEDMLQMYVRLQCQLGKPEYLPEIFHLYATKPIPRPGSGTAAPIKFSSPWRKLPKYAVPIDLAEAALESAILHKNLPLAIAIIDTTVAAPAFRTSRMLRKAGVPGAVVAATPLVAYAAADWVAQWQNTMDVEMAKWTAVAGAAAYIGTLSTIGFVAVTTYNDQMVRVVWRPGTHLSSRWLREEERRFFDRLALAWGFQEKARWGEEHGPEWLRLRDEVGLRDMILDKTDLMEGMQ
ncbi:hypothetical protein A1O7_06506 [Cladophialophora yegresii CBS 114405]|uniref:Uncharacterized protein n=1 Tax=Cladophialophora yegresii CBS 114405 TaxID=1182544 RepID=W9W256_9EURO|nr:uncharacterized protein A1O7_06506 [Cladophialophora yegresii CBS 114405]EXJ59075.1 hypothetical protein A1O7_06506 [Cladophialophora yegresii CBS 114405]